VTHAPYMAGQAECPENGGAGGELHGTVMQYPG